MRILFILLFLVGCGTQEKAANQATTAVQANPVPISSNVPENPSLYIGAGDPIPDCEKSNEDQLIYVLDQKEFQACDGAKWQIVDISGKAGIQGVKGETGATGASGKDAPVIPSNEWLNPITGKYWIRIGMNGMSACTNGWRSISLQELQDALSQGLGGTLPSPNGYAYIQDVSNGVTRNYFFATASTAHDFSYDITQPLPNPPVAIGASYCVQSN